MSQVITFHNPRIYDIQYTPPELETVGDMGGFPSPLFGFRPSIDSNSRDDVPTLTKVLRNKDPRLHEARGAAAIALGVLADRELLAALVEIAKSDEDARTRAYAVAAIGWCIDRDPVPRISKLLSGIWERFATGPTREVMTIL